jgi:FMNH2-dependent dimethyl sulfone monooxygenase
VSLEDYSVSNRGLRSGLVGTPEQVVDRIRAFEEAGVDLLLLQFSPQYEEMERFAAEVIPHFRPAAGITDPSRPRVSFSAHRRRG